MASAIAHHDFLDYHGEEADSEQPLRPSEQYSKGGRDTVLLAWGTTGLLIAGFMLCSAAAGAPRPAPTAMTSAAP